jgi:hypothetical protein
MAKLIFTAEIAAAADRVAAFFVPQRMVYWYGADMAAEFEVQGGAADFAAGQKVRITGRIAGKEVTLTAVVMRYEPGRVLEWEFCDAYGVRGMQSWEIVANGDGTRVTMRDHFEFPGSGGALRKLLSWFTRRTVARRNRGYLTKLKQLCERS